MATKTTTSAAPTVRDQRTDESIARTEMGEWLRGKMPDEFPPDPLWHPTLLTKSMLADRTAELEERYKRKFGHQRLWPRMKFALDELRGKTLDHKLNRDRLETLRDQVDATIAEIEAPPPAPPPLTAIVLELGRDLGLTLPTDRDRATQAVIEALRRVQPNDWRVSFHYTALCEAVFYDAIDGHALRARHVLVGHAPLPPVRGDDDVFAATADELCSSVPSFVALPLGSFETPRWLDAVGIGTGHGPRPSGPDLEVATMLRQTEEEFRRRKADLDARERDRKPDDRNISIHNDRIALERWHNEQRANVQKHAHAKYAVWHTAIVASIDKKLGELRAASPALMPTWWCRELRRHVAMVDTDRGLAATGALFNQDVPGEELAAWRACCSFNLFPEPAAAPRKDAR